MRGSKTARPTKSSIKAKLYTCLLLSLMSSAAMYHLPKFSVLFLLLVSAATDVCGFSLKPHRTNPIIKMETFEPKVDKCIFNICEYVEDYPEDLVEKMVDENSVYKSYFGDIIKPSNHTVSIISRNDDEEFEDLCITQNRKFVPQQMFDVFGRKRLIVNTDKYQQYVEAQTCLFGDCKCVSLDNHFGRSRRCEQHFINIKLLEIDAETKKLDYSLFPVPSTCVCMAIETKDLD